MFPEFKGGKKSGCHYDFVRAFKKFADAGYPMGKFGVFYASAHGGPGHSAVPYQYYSMESRIQQYNQDVVEKKACFAEYRAMHDATEKKYLEYSKLNDKCAALFHLKEQAVLKERERMDALVQGDLDACDKIYADLLQNDEEEEEQQQEHTASSSSQTPITQPLSSPVSTPWGVVHGTFSAPKKY